MRNIIGKSVQGRDLVVHANFPLDVSPAAVSRNSTLLIGGTHGDERATVAILDNFHADWIDSGKLAEPVAILSLHNPDGYAADTRYNGRGVDLNRNFGHQWSPDADEPPGPMALSEPENRALHAFILAHRPAKIISLHWALSELDADGPQSAGLAARMWQSLTGEERRPYRLSAPKPAASICANPSYCAGSLGQWCGNGLLYPDGNRPAMVTLELPYHAHVHDRPETLPADHLDSVRELWRASPETYLEGVQGPVHRMLAAAIAWQHPWPVPGSGSQA